MSNEETTKSEGQQEGDLLNRIVRHWADLAELPDSDTHCLEIDIAGGCGWIKEKRTNDEHYLSTHTFYGSKHIYSTLLLQKCGFNVTVANWDMPNSVIDKPSSD